MSSPPSQPSNTKNNQRLGARRLFSLLLVSVVFMVVAGYWLMNSSTGLQWALSLAHRISADMVRFEGVQGTLRDMRIEIIHFNNPELELTLRHFDFSWNPGQLFIKHLAINQLTAGSMTIRMPPSTKETPDAILPESLTIPLSLSLKTLSVDEIQIITGTDNENTIVTITDFSLSFDSTGNYHQLSKLYFHTHWGTVNAVATLNGEAPFDLSAQIDLSESNLLSDGQILIDGNLAHIKIDIDAYQSGAKQYLSAQLKPFSANPIAQLHAELIKINPSVFFPDAPVADLAVTVHLSPNEYTQLKGIIEISNTAPATIDQNGIPITAINAHVLVTEQSFQSHDIRVQIATKEILVGNIIWSRLKESLLADFTIDKLDLQQLDNRSKAARVSGKIHIQGDAQQQTAHMTLKDNEKLGLNAAFVRTEKQITLQQLDLHRNRSHLSGQGKIIFNEMQSFDFSGKLINFNLAEFIQGPDSDLNAAIELNGKLEPTITGSLKYTIEKSHWARSPLVGAGQITLDGLEQFQGKIELTIGSNQLLAYGSISESNTKLQLDIEAPALNQIGFGLAGDLRANIALKGNFKSPNLKANVISQKLHLPGRQFLSQLSVSGHLDNNAISLQSSLASYAIDNQTKLRRLTIDSSGSRSNHTLSAGVQIDDDTAIQLKAGGSIQNDGTLQSLHWKGQLTELFATGKIPFRLEAPTALSLNSELVSLGQTKLSISNGFLYIDQLQWTPRQAKTSGHFSGIAIFPGSQQTVALDQALHIGGRWDFISSNQLKGNLQIQRERGDWFLPGDIPQSTGIETLQLQITAMDAAITSTLELTSRQLGYANAQLTIPIKQSGNQWAIATEAPLRGEISSQISNLKWVDAMTNHTIAMNGQLQVDTHIKGTLNHPDFSGTVSGKELSIILLEHGLDLQQGYLSANFQHTNLSIDRLDFITPYTSPPDNRLLKEFQPDETPGSLKITGNIGLLGDTSHLDLNLERLVVAQDSDYWVIASGSTQVNFNNGNLRINGNIKTDSGLLIQAPESRPDLAEDIVFTNHTTNKTAQKLPVFLNINLDLGEKFFIRASGLEGRLVGHIQIESDKANTLKANGSISAEDTTFKAYGQDLTVQRGIVSFQGPLDDPGLNVLAIRKGLEVEAGVEVLGTVRNPQIHLVSTPNVPDAEKLSWIVLGRKPDTSGMDTSTLLSAAGSILGGQSGGITNQIAQTLGVDEITVKQAGIGSSLSGQIGVVGKRISSRLYLSYERSLSTTTMGITKLTYNLTPKLTIVTQAGEDSAMDLFYTFQFD